MLWLIWILAALGLALWSLLAWGTHELLSLDPARIGALEPLIQRIPYGEWIERWIPGWQEWLKLLLELTQTLLGWIGGAAPIVVGVLWAIGALLLLGAAAVMTLIVRLASKPKPA